MEGRGFTYLNDEKPTSGEALADALKAHKEFGKKGEFYKNAVLARNILHSDLGYHRDEPRGYAIRDETRDTLIANGRQDAAHAVINDASILAAIKSLRRLVWIQFALMVLLMFMMHAPR